MGQISFIKRWQNCCFKLEFLPPRMANAQNITFNIILQWKFDPYFLVWHQVSTLCCGRLSWVRLEKKLSFIILNERYVVVVLNILLFLQRSQISYWVGGILQSTQVDFQKITRIKSGPWKQLQNIANFLLTPSASSVASIQLQLVEKFDMKSFNSIFVFAIHLHWHLKVSWLLLLVTTKKDKFCLF